MRGAGLPRASEAQCAAAPFAGWLSRTNTTLVMNGVDEVRSRDVVAVPPMYRRRHEDVIFDVGAVSIDMSHARDAACRSADPYLFDRRTGSSHGRNGRGRAIALV